MLKSNILVRITSFSKTTLPQREPFLTMFYTIISSPLLVIKLGFMIIFWVITNSVQRLSRMTFQFCETTVHDIKQTVYMSFTQAWNWEDIFIIKIYWLMLDGFIFEIKGNRFLETWLLRRPVINVWPLNPRTNTNVLTEHFGMSDVCGFNLK